MKIFVNRLNVIQYVTNVMRAIFQVISHDSGKGSSPTSVPQLIKRYGRTLRAPRRLNLWNISFQYGGTPGRKCVTKQLNSTRTFCLRFFESVAFCIFSINRILYRSMC
ncbi:hypothetical protein NPIL_602131 [Nephila pilipes]|uniref:Uncharacterized protein n=1 Tax=Nephila pilipes TaxID=299642 RepID=A0A8X6TGI6_NEPPI|nr:hypothetical protein NPIL_602131 [Nephila pilipes]